jgi:hypothetical protein
LVRKDPRHFGLQYFICKESDATEVIGGFVPQQIIPLDEVTNMDHGNTVVYSTIRTFLANNRTILD